jgi:hypothetical protein
VRTTRSREFHLIKKPEHNVYYACQIPFRFWDEPKPSPTFRSATLGTDTVKSSTQQEAYDKLLTFKPLRKPYLVLFCSEPTDEIALVHAFHFCKLAVLNPKTNSIQRRIHVDVATFDLVAKPSAHSSNCDFYVLHNVMSKADKTTVAPIRSWITSRADTFRIVISAGTPDDFRHNYGLEPDVVFLFDSTSVVRKTKSFG